MNCTHPCRIFPTGRLTENGKPEYFYTRSQDTYIPISSLEKKWPDAVWTHPLTQWVEVPCGKCYGCLSDKSRAWSFRVVAESLLYDPETIWFFTLTYDNAHLPLDGYPSKADLSKFIKGLRKLCPNPIRFFACGELGEHTLRPHIHVVLFGFPGKDFVRIPYDLKQFTFPRIEALWSKGFAPGSMVMDSGSVGSYVAKYMMKDFGRSGCWLDMSRRPGIGYGYLEKLALELDPQDPAPLVIPDGKGHSLTAGVPKSLRQRLGICSDLLSKAAYIKQFNKMISSGFSPEQAVRYSFIEAYRESLEKFNRSKEAYRNYFG